MFNCLYKCGSGVESTQAYHVYPASASNIQVVLETGVVCDKCNEYFSKLENYFVHYHPGADARVLRLQQTKKGKQPRHTTEAGEVLRAMEEDGIRLQIPMSDIKWTKTVDGGIQFDLSAKARPYDPTKISRVLGKIAIESAYAQCPIPGANLDPFSQEFDDLRQYVRFWRAPKFIWLAYKNVEEIGGAPRIALVRNGANDDDELLGCLCEIRLPGIRYLFPYPPYLESSQIRVALEGWTVVDSPEPHTPDDLTATIRLKQKTPDESMP